MSSIPKDFASLPPEMQGEIINKVSERDVYNFVNSNKEFLFSKLEEMPFVAKKYYTYVINQEIWKVHKDQRLTMMFHETTDTTSKSEKELKTLLPSDQALKYLTRLNLSGLSKEEIQVIINHLPENLEHITEVNLQNSDINSQDLQELLKICPNITHLDLIDFRGVRDLDLKVISNLPYLKDINFSGCDITSQDLQEFLKICPNLEILFLHRCKNIKNLDLKDVPQLVHLKFLDSGLNNITSQDLQELLKICPNLESLSLHRCKNIKNLDLKDVPQLTHLKFINFASCNITSQDLQELLKICPNLESLDFNDCKNIKNLDLKDVPQLTRLKEIIFSKDSLTTQSFQELLLRSSNATSVFRPGVYMLKFNEEKREITLDDLDEE